MNSNMEKRINRRRGNFALYAIVFLMVGVILSIFIFFPQFLNMQSGIYGISCREIRQRIKAAVEEYDANHTRSIIEPGKRIDLDTLKEKGYLKEIRLCPEKGEYRFDENGRVICTQHQTENKN
jgi:competence protein ComGC